MSSGGLVSIDLISLRLSSIEYAPKIGGCCHACKIDKNKYFFQGGRAPSTTYRSDAIILNTKEKNYEILKNGPSKDCGGGTVLKNNKIYLFGGHNGAAMNSCETFNLESKEWKPIHELPKPSYGVLAANLNNEIILSGYHHDCLYSYNNSVYTAL